MIRIFSSYGPVTLVPLLIWSAIISYVNLYCRIDFEFWQIGFHLAPFNPIEFLSSVLVLSITAHFINVIYQDYDLVKKKNAHPGVFYVLLVGLIPEACQIEVNSWIALILTAAIYFLFRMYRKVHNTTMVFNVALLTGLVLFIDLSYWPFIVFFAYGIILVNYFKFNEWILYFLTIGLPFFYHYIYLSFESIYQSWQHVIGKTHYCWNLTWIKDFYPSILLVGLLSLIYVGKLSDILRVLRIGPKKYYRVLHYFFLLSLVLYFIVDYSKTYGLKILAVPLAIMIASCSSTTKSESFAVLLFYLLILNVILFQLYF